MREILFRGKRVGTGNWIEGGLVYWPGDDEIGTIVNFDNVDEDGNVFGEHIEVELKTVGQFTGLMDKNGKKIFEGDVVKTEYGRLCIVTWFSSQSYCGWDLTPIRTVENCNYTKLSKLGYLYKKDNLEVIGNVYDNPEFSYANNIFFGLTFSDYPEDIANSLERADAHYRRDEISQTFYIKSRNVEDPLTESEKGRISAYLGIRGFPMRIVFEN